MSLPAYEAAFNRADLEGEPLDGAYRSANGYDVYFFFKGVYLGMARFSGKESRWRGSRSGGYQGLNKLATSATTGLHDTWNEVWFELRRKAHLVLNEAEEIGKDWQRVQGDLRER